MIYPMSGRIVNTSYDSAGRAVCVTTQAPGTVCTSTPTSTYVNNVVYAPDDAVSTLPMGNGTTETTTFNTRFQPTTIQAGSLLMMNYTYGTGTNGTAGDNGNVLGASATRVPPGGGSAQTWTWSLIGYDGANRLTGLSESVTGGGGSLTESWQGLGGRWRESCERREDSC